jgi:hypothetical protein
MGVKLGLWHWEELCEGVWEQGAEDNIFPEDDWSNGKAENTA